MGVGDYTAGFICAASIELTSAIAMLDQDHSHLPQHHYSATLLCRNYLPPAREPVADQMELQLSVNHIRYDASSGYL
jgi:hypothetical protein